MNLLAHDQAGVAAHLATKHPDKFSQVSWRTGEHGSLVLDGSSAWLEAEVRERLRASTHTIFIGRVLAADSAPTPPLVYMASKFYDGGTMQEA